MVYGLLYLAFGLLALVYSWVILKQRRVVHAWPTVPGKFLEKKVDLSPGGRAGRTSPPAFQYEALVKYSYQVNGREFTNDKLYRSGWVPHTRETRQRLLDSLPAEAVVRYNPQDPQDSCLLAPPIGGAFWGIGLGVIVTLSAMLYLLVTLLD